MSPTHGHAGYTHFRADNFPDFRHELTSHFSRFEIETTRSGSFRGSLESVECDRLGFSAIASDNHTIVRGPHHIAGNPGTYYKMSFVRAGRGLLIQGRNETLLRPGVLVVYDADRPYTIALEDGISTLVLTLPYSFVNLPRTAVDQVTAVAIETGAGAGVAIAPYLHGLAANLAVLDSPLGARLARHAADMVTTLVAQQLDIRPGRLDSRSALLRQIRHYVEAHLCDPSLSPREIAATHFISTRYLHTLFESEGVTVSAWIREKRLDAARYALSDPTQGYRSIADTATACGFADSSHFSRSFRAVYGETPRTFRARMLGCVTRSHAPQR